MESPNTPPPLPHNPLGNEVGELRRDVRRVLVCLQGDVATKTTGLIAEVRAQGTEIREMRQEFKGVPLEVTRLKDAQARHTWWVRCLGGAAVVSFAGWVWSMVTGKG